MDLNLKNHVAVITGGASGIGRATAHGFAAEGACVAVWDRDAKVEQAAQEIGAQFAVPAVGLAVDVTDAAAVWSALQHTVKALGPIDHLVHAAAIGSGPLNVRRM